MAKPNFTEVANHTVEEAKAQGVPPELALAIMHQESRGRVDAKSGKGAIGPMQLMPKTAEWLGVDPHDWKDNIKGGVAYIGRLLDKYNGNTDLALAAYNAGPTIVDHVKKVPQIKETQNYVQTIKSEIANGLPGLAKTAARNSGEGTDTGNTTMASKAPSYDELMSGGTSVGNKTAPAAAKNDGPKTPSYDDLMSKGVTVGGTNAKGNAEPSFTDKLVRQVGLTARAAGPYATSALGGAAAATALAGPEMAPVGAVAGPAALGIYDLGSSLYNAVGPRLGAPRLATGTELVDRLADKVGLPRPENATERIASDVSRGLLGTKGFMEGANAAANTVSNATGKGILQSLGANPGTQYAASVGATVAPDVAHEVYDVNSPAALMGLSLLGGIGAGALAAGGRNMLMKDSYVDPKTGKLIQAGRSMGVNLTAAEAAPESAGGKVIRAARNVGVTDKQNNRMAGEVTAAVDDQAKNLAPASLGAAPSSESANRIVANDLRANYAANKATAGKLYDAVDEALAKDPTSNKITLANTQSKAAELLQQFPDWATLTNASQGMKSRLESIVRGTSDRPSVILGSDGRPMMVAPDTKFQDMRMLSKEVGQLVEATRTDPKLASVHGQLKNLYGAIQSDADTWATTTTNKAAADAYSAANSFFKDNVVPFRNNSTIYNVVSSRKPTETFDKGAEKLTDRIISTGPETTNLALSLMSDSGKGAFQFDILNSARTRMNNPYGGADFTAPGFFRELNLGSANSPTPERMVFGSTPGTLDNVITTADVVDAARGTATPKVTPKTGVQLVPYASAGIGATVGDYVGGLLGLPPGLSAGAGAIGTPMVARGVDSLLSTPAMTDFLLSAPYQRGAGLLGPTNQVLQEYNTK